LINKKELLYINYKILFFYKNFNLFEQMENKIIDIIQKYDNLQSQSIDMDIISDLQKSKEIAKEMKKMEKIYNLWKKYIQVSNNIKESQKILKEEQDQDLIEMAQKEFEDSKVLIFDLEEKIKIELLPKDENDDKNIYLEIRPAAGGDEAGLFATELLRAYIWYADRQWRKSEMIEEDLSDLWWIKFVMVKITWSDVYSKLKRESGVHRVQRIPKTESQWRVHTSTITVAIMPEVDDVDVKIDPNDITMDTFAASSAGWQNANKNQTWVRLHHNPTWIIVTISDSKSQLQNKEKAYNVLKAKLYQLEIEKKQEKEKNIRNIQIWTWERSEKIRTYNFPQDRVTDHRIKKSRSNIPVLMQWDLDDMIDDLNIEYQSKLLTEWIGN